jgi:hypothetical protein
MRQLIGTVFLQIHVPVIPFQLRQETFTKLWKFSMIFLQAHELKSNTEVLFK